MRQTEVALQHLATHDALTDLPNRFLLVDRLNQLLSRAHRAKTNFAVLFMDIDRFKDVNDSHGHEVGDLLLRGVGQRLSKGVRASDTVARMGGDEFVILLEAAQTASEADTVALKVAESIAKPFTLDGRRLSTSVSIGVSFYPDNGEDAETLLRSADYAMYLAKREGGNRHRTSAPGTSHSGEPSEQS